MNNIQVGAVFREIAELMELKGENPYKIKAYEKASRIISGFSEPLSDYVENDRLEEIPGIGKGIARIIKEVLGTGKSSLLEDLRDEFPPQILSLLHIPGLGAKKASQLYRELGISSIQELKSAILSGSVASLKGFGKKTQENILKGIDLVSAYEGRLPLGVILPLTRNLVGKISEIKGVKFASE
ncbi:MAG: hypothetical protein J7M18_07865, partial [Candidatus Eremiobacteraeota bacterium]|nr:hypothetical protein [Candidatus Eremiobacteraeota bacterium]